MVKIIDENGLEKSVLSLKKIKHPTKDVRTGDTVYLDYLECLVVGKNSGRKWTIYIPYDVFKDKNPGIDI